MKAKKQDSRLCVKGTEHLWCVEKRVSDFGVEIVAENMTEEEARLFAAAPAMLAALRELCADPYLSDPINDDRMAAARAAIENATQNKTQK